MKSKETAKLRDDTGGRETHWRKSHPRRQSALPLCVQHESSSAGSGSCEVERKETLKRETDEESSSMQAKEEDTAEVTEEME